MFYRILMVREVVLVMGDRVGGGHSAWLRLRPRRGISSSAQSLAASVDKAISDRNFCYSDDCQSHSIWEEVATLPNKDDISLLPCKQVS